jgi:uncharacterized protein YacL
MKNLSNFLSIIVLSQISGVIVFVISALILSSLGIQNDKVILISTIIILIYTIIICHFYYIKNINLFSKFFKLFIKK